MSQPSSIERSAIGVPPAENSSRTGLAGIGGIALLASVVLCASSHLILRGAASGGAETGTGGMLSLLFDPRIIGGLSLYASGTALWIFCLSRLELSLAFPASAVQLVVIYAGARWFLGEEIPALRLAGGAVILVGIGLLFLEGKRRHV